MIQTMSLIEELRSDACQCGRAKKAGRPFCLPCFRVLPAAVQKGLYRRIGRGYEAARMRADAFFDGGSTDGEGDEKRAPGQGRELRVEKAVSVSEGGETGPPSVAG